MEKYTFYKGAKFLTVSFSKAKAEEFIKKDRENKAKAKKLIAEKKRNFAKGLIEIEKNSSKKK